MKVFIRFPAGKMNSLKCETYKFDIIVPDKPPVGFMSFRPLTGTVCKVGYEVVEAERGHGIASAALFETINQIWLWGFDTIITGVRSDNFASKAVLFKNGFRVDYITDETDGKYYQCRLERSWYAAAQKAYWFTDR